ncbi:methylmalonyl-CoA mutase subunit beta [Neobacillus niacini]|uniref:methylmalonyl-CoA mutase subunit beta n=1 Tax=Neobacillus niacini TaxID=86668 RepID=UPI00052FCF58|nr:methylmalonyl-CoA mutase subunit beta [Neobacillus niacini]KGM46201.1 methylmalonyl-CoA mutase [Neobacillus niacini]MEC1523069.1 methylmalonyl-CoA mutase subunit beta [Neobacillus niacini]
MSLDNLRNQSFPLSRIEDWQAKAEETLKGKSIEKLKSSTYENIILKPLYYRRDKQQAPEYPGGTDFRRGIYPLGYVTNDWKVAQKITYHSVDQLKEKLQGSVEKGQTALSFEVSEALFESKGIINEILGDLPDEFPFAVNGRGIQSALLAALTERKESADLISGYVGSDPISLFAETGFIEEDFFKSWMIDIKLANEKLPKLRTVLINTSTYHQGGANAVQELGIAAATGIFHLQKLLDSGMKLENVLGKMIFQFSIGSNFFMELAKIRAARILWNKITNVYGADPKDRGMHIAAETSSFTKTVYDPYVNLLRAGNEGFAAVLGGVQYLHITPFDDITGSSLLSERIARNTQNILKEEAYLQKVVDPAGGSWYVEALTVELAEKAWQYFQQIEAKGGMLEVLKSGWLQDEITCIRTKREQDVSTRKQSIVGTNVYANLAETAGSSTIQTCNNLIGVDGTNTIKIKRIKNMRLSEPFEKLRKISEEIESKSGSKPKIGMICLGELKNFKPRLDFMRGFAAAGGIEAVESGSITSLEDAKQFVIGTDTKYFCLCGSNDHYESIGHDILSELNREFPERTFYLAGLPEKELQTKWSNEGIKQFIHMNCNCYEILSTILKEMGVA